ncbi:MAG: hypothetical protein ACRETH_00260 [Steroidobacteraceae bacterium]
MSGDKRSQGLVKFWWVLAAMLGAAAGAAAEAIGGATETAWGIVGIGLSLALAVGYLERPARPGRGGGIPRWPRAGMHAQHRHPEPAKGVPRRAKLHAVSGRKRGEPPNSGGA